MRNSIKDLARAMKLTKADKVDALIALALVVLLAMMGYLTRYYNLLVVFGFPFIVYAICFWMRRASTARMEDMRNEDVAVFSRQPVTRLLFGVFALGIASLFWLAAYETIRDNAHWQYPSGEVAGIISMYAVLLGGLCLPFLCGAGPYRVRLDLRRRQYSFTQGIPLVPLTKRGPTDGSILYVTRVRSGQYQVRFRPLGHRWGYLLDTYRTDEAARAQAWRLADALGLDVERRDAH